MPTQSEIQTCINNLDSSVTAGDIIYLAAETDNLTANRSITVATVDDLPDLSLGTVGLGTVMFVESLGVPVIADVNKWTGLDGRLLRRDYTLSQAWAWGRGSFGYLGDGTTTNKSSPVSVVGGFTDWCQVSAGGYHSLGLRTNGSAWAWGVGLNGRLGDGTIVSKSSPVSVVGGFTWCQVSAGAGHNIAIQNNGTARAWGLGANGRLGTGSTTAQSSPTLVVGGFTDWCQVSAGGYHSLGVRSNGSAWAWGLNNNGRLGDGTTVSKLSPVSVVGGFTWCQVSAGGYHSLGLRSNGSVWAWGLNNNGQLGDGTTVNKSSPVSVVGGFTDWCQVSAGICHSISLRSNGTAWTWGLNNSGQLGDGTAVNKSSPVSVVGGFTNWCQASAGRLHSIGVRTNGTVWAWGSNVVGQLGDTTIVNNSSPVSVVGNFTNWCQVAAGYCHSLAIRNF